MYMFVVNFYYFNFFAPLPKKNVGPKVEWGLRGSGAVSIVRDDAEEETMSGAPLIHPHTHLSPDRLLLDDLQGRLAGLGRDLCLGRDRNLRVLFRDQLFRGDVGLLLILILSVHDDLFGL